MPLLGIPSSITPELLYALARMGHGDMIVIADANFPSGTVAKTTTMGTVIQAHGSTVSLLNDILKLIPVDAYDFEAITLMDRVDSDKAINLVVPAHNEVNAIAIQHGTNPRYLERFQFYEKSKRAFAIVQTDDRSLYANIIVSKGVIP